MRDLRIVFMGTPEFAVSILKSILEEGYKVIGVITAPDKPAGRGRKLQESAVKIYAGSKSLNIMQPTNLRSPEFIKELRELQPNVQVVVAFRMLPKTVWELPEYGTFNLHASLLPQYRGAAPINWAIINGEKITGVSTFFIDEKIDTGEIILKKEVNIGPEETVGELHDKLMNEGASLVVKTLKLIEQGIVETQKQEIDELLKEAPKLNKENTRINWSAPVEHIYNLIRGLNPYPAAWSELINGSNIIPVQIFGVILEWGHHNYKEGTILLENKNIKVAAQGGFINIIEIKLPGKRKMKVSDLLNGYKLEASAKLV